MIVSKLNFLWKPKWPDNMSGHPPICSDNARFWPDIVRWPAVISSPLIHCFFKAIRGFTAQGPHSHILMTGGVRRIFLGLTFWPKGLWKTPGFFWVAKTTEGFFLVLYFSSAQIKNNISASYSVVFDQNQSWSWHVLAFRKINNKICWCKQGVH